MRFPFKFDRTVGGAGTALGADVVPVDATYLTNDNVYITEVPAHRVINNAALGYKYDGVGPAPTLTATLHVYDGTSAQWFVLDTVTFDLEAGDIQFEPLPHLIGALRAVALDDSSTPTSLELALVVAAAGGEPAGTYSFYIGMDVNPSAEAIVNISPASGLATEVTLAAAAVSVASLDAKLAVDADGAAATTNPVVVAGQYLSDPSASLLADGAIGRVLIDDEHKLVTHDQAYNDVAAANQVLPVWSQLDGYAAAPLDSSLGANGTVTKYVRMGGYLRWSLLFASTKAAAEEIAVTVAYSNDDVEDATTAVFKDVTKECFNVSKIVDSSAWIAPDAPVACEWLRVQTTVTGWTAGTSSWVLRIKKLGQA